MIRYYFKTCFRNLARNKSYAFINISGLAMGIAVCMMIFIVIQYHTGFDSFHSKKERIYRVLTEYRNPDVGSIVHERSVPYLMPDRLKKDFPAVGEVAAVYASHDDELLISGDDGGLLKKFKEERGVFFTGPSFFRIFDFPLLAGSYNSLRDRNTVLLTKEIAEKYFGDWRMAVGKTIKLQSGGFMFDHGTDVLKIVGILAPIPVNTDFQIKLVVSIGTSYIGTLMAESTNWNETTPDFGCYISTLPNASAGDLNRRLRDYVQKIGLADKKSSYIIQPLRDIHYDIQTGNYGNKAISHQLLDVLWLIAIFILAIACINFVNLSTAQAIKRAKEVGVRKVLGSNRFQLRLQFMSETFLIVVCAMLLALAVSVFSLPSLNRILELSISISVFSGAPIICFLIVVTIVVTGFAGFYPSIVLSGFNPVTALKHKLSLGAGRGVFLRRGLVVFQFAIAQFLIVGTFVILKQVNYFMNQPLGFDKDAIVNVPFRTDSVRLSKMDYIKDRLLSINGVKAVSFGSNTPMEDGNDGWSVFKFDHGTREEPFKVILKFGDDGYIPAYKLGLVAGRNLRPSAMTREFLVNESLLRSLGIRNPNDILNKEISIWEGMIKCPVVGVLKDFNNRSLRSECAPLLITTNSTMYNQAAIKFETRDMEATMRSVKDVWEQTFPDFVYEYKFLDDKIGSFYKQERQLAQLYEIFAAIAIFLSCLGLYGLVSFMAVHRIKEVGIRKVLGASVASIIYLFSGEFVMLILVAFAIAVPVSWYFMHEWLQDYVYRIDISWWIFAASGLTAVVIALGTIGYRAAKTALADPVKSLRAE